MLTLVQRERLLAQSIATVSQLAIPPASTERRKVSIMEKSPNAILRLTMFRT